MESITLEYNQFTDNNFVRFPNGRMMDVESFIPSQETISEIRKIVKEKAKVYHQFDPEFFVIDYGFGLQFYKRKF